MWIRSLKLARRVVLVLVGFTLLAGGLVMSVPLVPGPGLLVVVVAVAILAAEFVWARRLLRRLKEEGRRLQDRMFPGASVPPEPAPPMPLPDGPQDQAAAPAAHVPVKTHNELPDMRRVLEPGDVHTVASLAQAIWTRHYLPIIGREQTDYMLDRFQSPDAIRRQIEEGYQYYLALVGGIPVGYLALVPDPAGRRAQLSKLYVQYDRCRTGIGRAMVSFAEERGIEMGADELWLTVNRHNADAIAFYTRVGFVTTGTLIQDIGGGFAMDDFRLAKRLARPVDPPAR